MRFLLLKYGLFLFCFGNVCCTNPNSPEVVDKTETEKHPIIFHPSHEPKKADAPFSDIVQVGNLYFLSGQIGMNHTTRELVSGGIRTETLQTLENIKAVLARHDLSTDDVVKATVILADIEDFSEMSEIYTIFFPKKPARTTFAAKNLARGAKIEIEVIAVRQ
tara:strand:+ start:53549 stop:54037 length:489 start_codon:yes stop_codon:yes gene_type:complete